ncbi:hypothetical protein ABK040_000422 [Willaertia magna]
MSLRRQVNELSTKFCQELENLKEKTIQETKKQLMEERQLLEEEKQQWEKEKQLMKTLNPKTNDIVYLNVGGRHFTTSITILTTFRNSFFTMFSGRFELSKTKDDCIFIDRDGDPFVYILEYLRDREIILPNKDVEVLKKKITILFNAPYKPNHISVDMNEDTIVMTCKKDQYVLKMSLDGQELIWKYGGSQNSGWKEGQICDPVGVVVDQKDSSIYVVNRGRNSVQVFSKDGQLLRELGSKFQETSVKLTDPEGIDLDQDGNLVIASTYGQKILTYSKKGQLLKTFGTGGKGDPLGQVNYPSHAIIEKCTGTMYIADGYNYRIQVSKANGGVRAFGTEGSKDNQFKFLDSLAINPLDGELYVADTGNARVTIFK